MPPESREATLSPQKPVSREVSAKGGDPALTLVLDRLTGGVPSSAPTTRMRGSPPSAGFPPVRRQFAGVFPSIDDRLRRRAARARHQPALHPSGRRHRARAGRPQRRHHDADGIGQDALLQRAGPERDPPRPVDACAVSVSDQGAGAGSAGRAARARRTSCRGGAELEIGVFTYDGDTPQDARRAIRGRAHVVLSNPDMIHSGILPHHPRWAKLFENLRFVVIDELHAYRGVFGSHLTNVLRRLRRICRHYGSNPTFICSSATIANPTRAGRGAGGAAVRARLGERRAARREVLPVRQPAGRQPAARHPPVVSGRDAPGRRRSSSSGSCR